MKHISFKNKLYAPLSNGLFRHYEEVPNIEVFHSDKNPPFYWEGGKISFALWSQIVSFMKWTQKTFKAEAHCTLFYNTETKEWAAWAFPQKTMGMTVALDTTDERYKEDRKRFNGSWIMAGSVHHHCTSKAFQSSTDSADEVDKEGIHVTVGEVLDQVVDLHARKVFNGTMLECAMHEFFEYPDWAKAVPAHLRGGIDSDDILGYIVEGEFPEEWKSRISERTFQKASSTSGTTGQGIYVPRRKATLVGGRTDDDWTFNDYCQFQEAQKKKQEQEVKSRIPHMEKVLDDWAMTLAEHFGIEIKELARLWLMPKDEADKLPEDQRAMWTSVAAAYNNLTIDRIRIPLLSIVDHMRKLVK